MKFTSKIVIFFIISVFSSSFVYSQSEVIKSSQKEKADSILKIAKETLMDTTKKLIKKSKSDIDSTVFYNATDSITFNLKSKVMRLRGKAKVNLKRQKLESEVIELHFNESLLKASGVKDTSKKDYGYPKFTDEGENFIGEKISYNFKTNQGTIELGETQISDGFYFGSKIKRVSQNELFVQDGKYTTCDVPHPHYYFGSPEMKVILQDRIFIDPIIFYVEEMPIFMVPFGLFFPNKTGRQSGLIIPSFFFSANRGVQIENLGIYLALSDYYDTKFSVDFFSKGGYDLKNFTQWRYRDELNGSMNVTYGKTRFNPDDNYSTNWSINVNHSQSLTPQENIQGNLSFSSKDRNRNTNWNIDQRIQQDIRSNASYSKTFDNGSTLSLSYSRSQNIINDTYNESPSISFNLPHWNFLKPYVSSDSWLKDFAFNYSINGSYNTDKSILSTPITVGDSIIGYDSTFKYNYTTRVEHRPSLNFTLPKMSYFNISPYFNFGFNNYFRRITKYFDNTDSTIKETVERGFFTEYSYNLGLNISTRLYGIVKPKIFGLNAIRHTIQPSIGWQFTPDLSASEKGFYNQLFNPKTNDNIIYSRFEKDGGGYASRYLSNSLTYSISNNIGAKLAPIDTGQERTIEILSFSLSGNYNFAADSLRLSDMNISFHTPTIGNLSFNGSSSLTFYDQDRIINRITGLPTENFTRINKFLLSNGKGLARFTNISFNLSTSFSSESSFSRSGTSGPSNKDSIGLGDRFSRRLEEEHDNFDLFGDNSPGYSKLILPWNLSLSINYSYSQYLINQINRSFSLRSTFGFSLTPTWSFNGSIDYDFINNELLVPSINIRKDMHCWELNMIWYPSGYSSGFYLRFGIKAPQLQDLKYEKRSSQFF